MTADINDLNRKHALAGWIPAAFDQGNGKIIWINGNNKDFDEPFFEDSLRVIKTTNAPVASTSLEKFIGLGKNCQNTIKPTVFIFHVSRCGSTLVTQMLAQSNKNIVYSEPPLLDEILTSDMDETNKMEALKAAITLMAQKRTDAHRYLFIKCDSWHLAHYMFIRKTFPDTSFLFLYRDPLEVLKSHHHIPGMQMVPGLLKKDVFNIQDIPIHDLNAYGASVLVKIFKWMVAYGADGNVRLVNYTELPGKLFDIIKGMELYFTPEELNAMHERTKKHSKQPLNNIAGDDNKHIDKEQLERLESLALKVRDIYNQLERMSKIKSLKKSKPQR